MHVVFRRDRDVSSKNPAGGVNPARVARRARRQGVLSLGYFSLHEQREVTRSCEAGAKARPSSFRFHTCPKPIELLGYHLGLRSCRFEKASKGWSRIKSFRSPSGREPPFFARAKKGGPKRRFSTAGWLVNTPLPPRPPCLRHSGSTPPAGFFDETQLRCSWGRGSRLTAPARSPGRSSASPISGSPLSRRKTTCIPARRPSGYSHRLRRCGRGP